MRKEYKYESKFSYWVCKNIHGRWDFYLGDGSWKKIVLVIEGKTSLGRGIKIVRFVVKKWGVKMHEIINLKNFDGSKKL